MQRALLLILLLANGLFFAWTRDWLAPWAEAPVHGAREPARLAAQVAPERIQILTPKAASAALSAARAASMAGGDHGDRGEGDLCMELGPFGEATFSQAETQLDQALVARAQWQRREVGGGIRWAVYMGRFADLQVMRSKLDELTRLKLDAQTINSPPELAPGLVLSRHDSNEAADKALALLKERGVRTARVVALPGLAPQLWLRIERADAALREQLRGVRVAGGEAGFVTCR